MFAMLAAFAAAIALLADEWRDSSTGYTWQYRINGEEAEVYAEGGGAVSPEPSGKVVIPSTLGGRPVTRIGALALDGIWHVNGVTEVVIPGTVKSIGESAFGNCGLSRVTIPGGVTNIERQAFNNCPNLENVMIPRKVKSIGEYAFMSCTGLRIAFVPIHLQDAISSNSVFVGCSPALEIRYFAPPTVIEVK